MTEEHGHDTTVAVDNDVNVAVLGEAGLGARGPTSSGDRWSSASYWQTSEV